MTPESNPAYLEDCLVAFLDAIREADALAAAGTVGPELAVLLQHAGDLVDIVADGLQGLENGAALLPSGRDTAWDSGRGLRAPDPSQHPALAGQTRVV